MSANIAAKIGQKTLEQAMKKTTRDASDLGGKQSFKEIMQNSQVSAKEEMMNLMGINQNQGGLESISANNIHYDASQDLKQVTAPKAQEKVVDMLSHVNKGYLNMEKMVHQVMHSGKKYSPQELLVVQSYIYNFTQMAEITVKVADQGVSSVKTILNTQIQ